MSYTNLQTCFKRPKDFCHYFESTRLRNMKVVAINTFFIMCHNRIILNAWRKKLLFAEHETERTGFYSFESRLWNFLPNTLMSNNKLNNLNV